MCGYFSVWINGYVVIPFSLFIQYKRSPSRVSHWSKPVAHKVTATFYYGGKPWVHILIMLFPMFDINTADKTVSVMNVI